MRWSGGGGMGSDAEATPPRAAKSSAASSGRLRRMGAASGLPALLLELHFRNGLAPWGRLEEGLLLEASQAGDDGPRHQLDLRVVVAHCLVEALTLDGDTVFRSLELALQSQKVLVALELGVALHRDQQTREGAPQLVLRVLELLESGRVVEELRGRLDAAGAGAGLGHLLEHGLLLGGEAEHHDQDDDADDDQSSSHAPSILAGRR